MSEVQNDKVMIEF